MANEKGDASFVPCAPTAGRLAKQRIVATRASLFEVMQRPFIRRLKRRTFPTRVPFGRKPVVVETQSVNIRTGVASGLLFALVVALLAACGNAVDVSTSYARAGLTAGGVTADGRWKAANTSTLTVNCTTGVYTVGGANLFTVAGQASDVSPLVTRLNYVSSNTPPAVMQCAADGTNFVNC